MSSAATKKTPKKEKEELPRQGTPIRTHLVTRAVSMQTRRAAQTPDEKKQEREARKAEDTFLRTRRSTPRKKAEKKENKPEEERPDNVLTSESEAETDEGEMETEENPTKLETNAVDTSNVDNNTIDTAKAEAINTATTTSDIVNTGTTVQTYHKDEQPVIVDSNAETKKQNDDVVEKAASAVQNILTVGNGQNHSNQEEVGVDERTKEINKKEQELLQMYNDMWKKENELREKFTEQERRRRVKASRIIDKEYERLMAELYSSPRVETTNTAAQTPSSSSSLLIPGTYTSAKDESEVDEEEPADNTGSNSKLEEEVERLRAEIKEKEQLLEKEKEAREFEVSQITSVLQQTLEKARHAERTFNEGLKVMESHLHKVEEENRILREEKKDMERRKELNTNHEAIREVEERRELVDCVSEALEAETASLEEKQKKLREDVQELEERKKEIENREQKFEAELQAAVRRQFEHLKALKKQREAQAALIAQQKAEQEAEEADESTLQENDDNQLPANYDESQENNENAEANTDDSGETYDENETAHDDSGYPEMESPAKFENSAEITEEPESPPVARDTSRKRRRLDDDDDDDVDGGHQSDDAVASDDEQRIDELFDDDDDEQEEGSGFRKTKEKRKVLIPYYAKRGLATAAVAVGVWGLVAANQIATYLPHAG